MQLPRLLGETRGTRGTLTLLGPLAPCSDTELLPGLPVHRWVSGGGIFNRQSPGASRHCCARPAASWGHKPSRSPFPAAPPKLAQHHKGRAAGLNPARALCPWAVPSPVQRCCPPGVSALLRGCVAAAGGSCKEPLPVSTDPEAKGRARHASWVSLGSARLAGEGWEFLKASGVALKRFNL